MTSSRPGEWGGRFAGVGVPPTGTWQCADGPIGIAAYQDHHWQAFLTMLDHPDDLSEPSLERSGGATAHIRRLGAGDW